MIKIIINCVIFCYDHGTLKVLLSNEGNGANTQWGILTGVLQNNQSADQAAVRLAQNYGVEKYILLRQLRAFIDPVQPGSGRNVTIGYYGLINIDEYKTMFGINGHYTRWWKVGDVQQLLPNHNKILDLSFHQIGNALRNSEVGFHLLPKEFRLSEIENLYKDILGSEANESNFLKKVIQKGVIVPLNKQREITIETEKLYKFNARGYEKLVMNNIFPFFNYL
ncbi:NrtR DNA-binding winged helix domain-containing protein [Flavobacterium johnsoniae]|uniref:NrtR DNA-binding winged helix domain-containing protein n=1 Tax=Flavobacterium johnsoniae TaxID=986 RepID=A0A1M5QVX6_FLAJO|nr:hypothetical protein [Flavobacterium johnsoniae]SHH17693.1 hypothetical protein SAMN05444388_107171 [Flavobacterium johnsoniae]